MKVPLVLCEFREPLKRMTLVHIWLIYSSYMVHIWFIYGSYMNHISFIYGSYMVNIWLIYGYGDISIVELPVDE